MDRLKHIRQKRKYKRKLNIRMMRDIPTTPENKISDDLVECYKLYYMLNTFKNFIYVSIQYIIIRIVIIFSLLNIYMFSNIHHHPIFIYFFGNTICSLSYINALIMSMFQIIQIMVWIAPAYILIYNILYGINIYNIK